MKAKEYVARLEQEEWSVEAMQAVALDLIQEIPALMKSRGVRSVGGGVAVIREIFEKWNAVVARSEGRLNKDGLEKLLRLKYPELMVIYDEYRSGSCP